MEKKFKRTTVTSALPYANGPVHIGHLAGVYVPADIYVRYLRLKKEDVLFIGGSDEHGVPITIRARKEIIALLKSLLRNLEFLLIFIPVRLPRHTMIRHLSSLKRFMIRANFWKRLPNNIMTRKRNNFLQTVISPENVRIVIRKVLMVTSARSAVHHFLRQI